MTKFQKVFYWTGQIAVIVLVGAWFWYAEFEGYYIRTSPRIAEPEHGYTIPYQTKGITLYIAKSDKDLQKRLMYVIIGSGTVTLLCFVLSGEYRRMTNPERKWPLSN